MIDVIQHSGSHGFGNPNVLGPERPVHRCEFPNKMFCVKHRCLCVGEIPSESADLVCFQIFLSHPTVNRRQFLQEIAQL